MKEQAAFKGHPTIWTDSELHLKVKKGFCDTLSIANDCIDYYEKLS